MLLSGDQSTNSSRNSSRSSASGGRATLRAQRSDRWSSHRPSKRRNRKVQQESDVVLALLKSPMAPTDADLEWLKALSDDVSSGLLGMYLSEEYKKKCREQPGF